MEQSNSDTQKEESCEGMGGGVNGEFLNWYSVLLHQYEERSVKQHENNTGEF